MEARDADAAIALVADDPGDQLAPAPMPRITPGELARLRARQLDRESVVRWERRADALAAPLPPGEGPLRPNGTGWLLSTSLATQLFTGRTMSFRHRAFFAYIGFYLVALGNSGFHPMMTPLGVALGLPLGIGVLHRVVARRRLQRWRKVGQTDSLSATAAGSTVRVSGVIAAEGSVPSLFEGRPSVLSRNVFGEADEMRGIDFTLLLDDGQRLAIDARGALLTDRPMASGQIPVCGPVDSGLVGALDQFPRLISALHRPSALWERALRKAPREASVGPGDRVEVVGILHHEVAPDGEAAPGRRAPIRHVLRAAGDGVPLLVRSLQTVVSPGKFPVAP